MGSHILYVAIGGAGGSVARFLFVRMSLQLFGPGFPWGTLLVNIFGSLAIGILSGVFLSKGTNHEPLRLLLMTGFLGGFTTFSAFSLDAVDLISRGSYGAAVTYIALSVIPAIIATVLGLAIARSLL